MAHPRRSTGREVAVLPHVHTQGVRHPRMQLRARLLALTRERGLGPFAVRRVEAALRTLETELGYPDLATLVGEVQLAQKVTVEGDDAVFIVIGEWADGTVDLVREQGSFPRDALVGWRPGQSLGEYRRELAAEPLPEVEPDDRKGSAHPLRRDAKGP